MLGRLITFFRENRAVRDFSITGTMIVLGGLAASHILASGLQNASGALSSLTMTAKTEQPTPTITRQVIRSVLDDDIITGTSKNPPILLDPCSGEQKLPPR